MTERAVKIELFDQFARVAQAVASGRRVEIVDVLANGERSVEELSRQVDMSVANTSRHLQVLKEAGLVAATRDGTRVRYRLASPIVYRFWVALRSLAAERLPGVQGLVDAYLGSREALEAISGDELLARLRAGDPLVVVDVRPAEEYRAAHVAGAVSIPLGELERRLRELPRDREVVAYCRGPYCAFAPEAVRTLREHGYVARYLTDGLPEWADAGRGVEAAASMTSADQLKAEGSVRLSRRSRDGDGGQVEIGADAVEGGRHHGRDPGFGRSRRAPQRGAREVP